MKTLIKGTILSLVAALFMAVPKAHAAVNLLQLCHNFPAGVGPGLVQTQTQGTLFPDSNGCVVVDQIKDVNGRDIDTLEREGFTLKGQYLPWAAGAGTGAPLQQASATPTCTYTTTALACIDKMAANVTSLTLAGMTAGGYYLFIPMQDGTGGRTLAQTAVTGAPALLPAESAANGYAVWLIKATSASAATFIADYPNTKSIVSNFSTSVATNVGQAVTTVAVAQAAPTIVAPGMTATGSCVPTTQGVPASWAGVTLYCIPQTNAVQLEFGNPTATTQTATATAVNVRLAP